MRREQQGPRENPEMTATIALIVTKHEIVLFDEMREEEGGYIKIDAF